jgi:hypothetical protein
VSQGVRFALFRRFTFQTGDTYMLLVKVFASKEAAEAALHPMNATWAELLKSKAFVGKKAAGVTEIVQELGIAEIAHAILPVDYEEPLITTDLRSLPKQAH